MMGRIGPTLLIEVVKQPDNAPRLYSFAVLARISPHRRFDG